MRHVRQFSVVRYETLDSRFHPVIVEAEFPFEIGPGLFFTAGDEPETVALREDL